jgi:hypothetical protein
MEELEIIRGQLELAIEEIKKINSKKTELLYDYVFESRILVDELILKFK